MNAAIRILILCATGYLTIITVVFLLQRKILYFPSHHRETNGLSPWIVDGNLVGFAREVATPGAVWLFLHGNAGQASDRDYVLQCFDGKDSVYILEYPGYGARPGSPSMKAFNEAATSAYQALRAKFKQKPVCVAGESIGSGPASYLAMNPQPPDKIVLITPFDKLIEVAAAHYPFLPVKLLLLDNWDNAASLKGYKGPVEIFGGQSDTIIPISHAKVLAGSKPGSVFHQFAGGHNDWADSGKVKVSAPLKNE